MTPADASLLPKPPPSFRRDSSWPELEAAALARVGSHGDSPRWQAALAALPELTPERVVFGDRVTAHGQIRATDRAQLIKALQGLQPWRKGPWQLFDVHIDTEWRSDWKWQRIAPAIGALQGQRILDVGSGNGYFGWRLLAAGADEVVGVDPSVLFYLQHQAICRYLDRLGPWPNHLLPLPFEVLPDIAFDLVMSMGVVYHRPQPAEHIDKLYRCTRPGGRLLLESLVVEQGESLYPGKIAAAAGRYARMRNVSIIPNLTTMMGWLETAGFREIELVDLTPTGLEEQRTTAWMTFESLAQALDPSDPGRTVEGLPAPVRAAVLARRPI